MERKEGEGLRYKINLGAPADERVTRIPWDPEPIDFSTPPVDYSDFTSVSVFFVIVGTMIGVSVLMSLTLPVASAANLVILKKVYLCYHSAELANKFIYLAQQPVTPENVVESTAQWVVTSIDLTQTIIFTIEVANTIV